MRRYDRCSPHQRAENRFFRGDYFNAPELLACEQAGVIPLVPKPLTSNSKAEGRFDKRDFIYDPTTDEYECPAGERAIHRFASEENG